MAGIRDHHDMVAWQLADELRQRVFDATEAGRVSKDFDFKNEIRDASSSVCRNLCEGFYRFSHRDGARFTTIARASLGETMDLVDEAEGRKYFSPELCADLRKLGKRAGAAIAGWLRHLLTTPDHPGLRPPIPRGQTRKSPRTT
jgi:four helix bundle protein